MPFSPDNPNRNRNFVILALAGTVVFCAVLGSFTALSLAERDTTDLTRFLTLLVGSLIPGLIAAFRSNQAAHSSSEAVVKADQAASAAAETADATAHALNGGLEARVRAIVRAENERQTDGTGVTEPTTREIVREENQRQTNQQDEKG